MKYSLPKSLFWKGTCDGGEEGKDLTEVERVVLCGLEKLLEGPG